MFESMESLIRRGNASGRLVLLLRFGEIKRSVSVVCKSTASLFVTGNTSKLRGSPKAFGPKLCWETSQWPRGKLEGKGKIQRILQWVILSQAPKSLLWLDMEKVQRLDGGGLEGSPHPNDSLRYSLCLLERVLRRRVADFTI